MTVIFTIEPHRSMVYRDTARSAPKHAPKGPWRGFFFIEADGQKTKKFALVVDAIVTEIA